MHGNAAAHNFEAVMNEAERVKGVMHEEAIALGAWTLLAGTVVAASGSNVVGMGAIMTNHRGLLWDAGADTGDVVTLNWCTPGHFRGIGGNDGYPSDTEGPQLELLVFARKLDTTGSAADNSDLALTANLKWLYSSPDEAIGARGGDTALNSLTTKASATLDAMAISTVEEAFHWYTLDIGARLEAESKVLKPYSAVEIDLSVDQTVGTALAVEVIGTMLRYRRHAAVTPRKRRV